MIKNIFPENIDNTTAVSFLICNWTNKLDGELLYIIESIFKYFGLRLYEGNGSCDDKTSRGKYNRIRKKFSEFLLSTASFIDLKLVSEPTYQDDFFPSKLLTAFSLDVETLNHGVVSIREVEASLDCQTIVEFYEGYLKKFGLFYGGVFLFPAKYGPDYYLSSVNTMPKGIKWGSNTEYVQRLNNWKENTVIKKIDPLDGYFREIYPYNFVVESHLKKRFEGRAIRDFMEEYGTLIQLDRNAPQYLWSIECSKLEKVSEALESSGLVLSSNTKPQ